MRSNKRRNKMYFLLILLLCLGIGYAALSTTLKINGTANINGNTWDIYWDDPEVSEGSIMSALPTITQDSSDFMKSKVMWTVNLDLPGDFYEFTIYVVNNGTIDAMITDIEEPISGTLPSGIKCEITYIDGTRPAIGDKLGKRANGAATRLKYRVRVYYDEETATASDLNGTDDMPYTFNLGITYGQADGSEYEGYYLGRSVKYDPVSNSTCTSGSTCYDWNVASVYDSQLREKVILQLDHNITPSDVVWVSKSDYNNNSAYGTNGKTDKGPITLLKTLESYTSGWNDALKLNYKYDTTKAVNNYGILTCVNGACDINGNQVTTNLKARIITGEELAEITIAGGADKGTIAYNWNQTSSNETEWYFFSRSNKVIGTLNDMPSGEKSSIGLKWMVANTTANSISGATRNAYGSTTGGYWTLTPVSNDATQVWSVGGSVYEPYNGNVGAYYAGDTNTYGIRPVIVVSKSVLNN